MKYKPKYPQPYSIKKRFNFRIDNEALESRVIDYLHAKAKYEARYRRSKQSRRMRWKIKFF